MRRRRSTSPGMLYSIAGMLIVASAQSVKNSSPNVFYVMTGIGILVCVIGFVKLFRSENNG
ncbi:hypothetical protein [Flavobacterium sp.]|uniref:hypothetical protein n=1 Tax=Flavobacterium sp. TaxID=239 RepID=UPI001223DB74|nr:hypothetical protein [Flavobacterium sp.]RZJ71242.1 MAG: hypothetical protein EOO49_10865 [Flavobacterium sp.]